MKKKIILVGGDPNSINSEIILKSWKKFNDKLKKRLYIISNYNLLKQQYRKLKKNIKIIKVRNLDTNINVTNPKVIDIKLNFKNPFKVSKSESSKFIKNSLNLAHNLALSNEVSGIINCSIDKKLLIKNNIGVTEYLANKCGLKRNEVVMLIKDKNFSVSPITTHLELKKVSKNIKTSVIVNKVKMIDLWYRKKLKKKPKIALLGLNPHNSELRSLSEERKFIIPAIFKLKKNKINVNGPFVADTIFINDYKDYDVVVGMYHDQVLAPFKSMFKFNSINITIGLKYQRVSPDHGTAINLIGKNKADCNSLVNCIKFISKF